MSRESRSISGICVTLIVLGWIFWSSRAETSDKLGQVAEEISRETTLPNESEVGRPLPLAAHWNSGQKPNGFGPEYQMDMIARGYHLLPWFTFPLPGQAAGYEYYEAAIKKAAKLHLPISFISTQWESLLSYDPQYLNLPADRNPNVIDSNGKVIPAVSPFGPVGPWREVGIKWTSSPVMKKLQEWYPDPPFVLFISNNEHPKLRWKEAENSQQFVTWFGKGKDETFTRRVIGDAWIQCYRSLQDGMRKGLTAASWKEKAVFIGFVAFGSPDFGRRADWMDDSLYIPGRLEPWPLAWDGACAAFGVDGNVSPITDYTVFSPQIFAMDYVFMQKEANALNPGFWFEHSTWDGHETVAAKDKRRFYASRGQVFTPERYAGMVKFGMWVLRPHVVREYRNWDDTVRESGAYFLAVADAVEMVHANPTLRKFWRHGRLVANNQRQHPYQINIPQEYRNVERWFLLDTSLDPPRPWEMSTELPVFALGLVLGESPEREWLVYAHSPLKERKDVEIVLPGYGPARIDVGPAGNYYHVVEKGKQIKPIL
jgi:hypothetical protein